MLLLFQSDCPRPCHTLVGLSARYLVCNMSLQMSDEQKKLDTTPAPFHQFGVVPLEEVAQRAVVQPAAAGNGLQ